MSVITLICFEALGVLVLVGVSGPTHGRPFRIVIVLKSHVEAADPQHQSRVFMHTIAHHGPEQRLGSAARKLLSSLKLSRYEVECAFTCLADVLRIEISQIVFMRKRRHAGRVTSAAGQHQSDLVIDVARLSLAWHFPFLYSGS
jgi:hypothetical protein